MNNDSIKKNLVQGVLYTGVAKYSGVLIALIISAILARLISPKDFGIMSVATVLIAFFSIFTDFGIGPAIIQKKELTQEDYSRIFSFSFWSGLILALLFFLCAPLIAGFYQTETLTRVCRILSLNLFFVALNIVPNGLLYKEQRFRYIAMRTFFVQLFTGVIAVVAALKGAGIYALLINPVLSAIAIFLINYSQYPLRLRLGFGTESIRKIYSYSLFQFMFNIINFFSRNIDSLLIGKFLSMQQLGFYDKSYRLMMLPLENITQVISPVMHPVFSEMQNNKKHLAEAYLRVVKLLAYIGFPLSAFLFFSAEELILLVFGPQWQPSVELFRILSLSVGFQVILSSSGAIFQASNTTKLLFLSGVISSLLNVIAIGLGVFYFKNTQAIATGLVISYMINFIQNYVLLFVYNFNQSIWLFAKELYAPIVVSLILAGALFSVTLVSDIFPLIIRLMVNTTVSFSIVLLYVHTTKAYDLKAIINKIRHHGG
ncbi:MAG: lipopolysaccharide biosynthesis protein [Bacteroidales bacterium]